MTKRISLFGILGVVALLVSYSAAQASGIFIPPRPPAIKKPGASKPGAPCEPADSEKCKAEKK